MEIVNISELLSIAIVGAFFSAIFEAIKLKYPSNPLKTKLFAFGISIVVGALYVWIKSTPFFLTFMTILASSSTVYAYFFNSKDRDDTQKAGI